MYQTYITLILIIILLYIIIKLIKEKNKDNDTNIKRIEELKEKELTKEDNNINKNQYKKKYFLTNTEKQFLSILYELKKYNLIIIPQINLATIIQKTGEFRYQNELYRNIDFGIFDKNYNILLLIELNDISHQQYKRRERDMKVKEIVKQADIKLINFYTDKPNKPEYVIKRIMNELAISIPNYEIDQIKQDKKDEQPSITHQNEQESI
nr:MAG TPA: Protein of unknown function (DUF2726) [Inoviridae sp.]